jgi:endonuclease YncB( thermonuclease family)
VIIDGEGDFGEKMIKDGYAYEYTYHGRKYKNQKKYKEAQKYAEKNELGL